MIKEGIVDPTKVTRSAILNASSISALFVTTEAAVTEIKEEKPAAPGIFSCSRGTTYPRCRTPIWGRFC
jgi:hypothetical protein